MHVHPDDRSWLHCVWSIDRFGKVLLVAKMHDAALERLATNGEPIDYREFPTDDAIRQTRWAMTAIVATWLHRNGVWAAQPLPFSGDV